MRVTHFFNVLILILLLFNHKQNSGQLLQREIFYLYSITINHEVSKRTLTVENVLRHSSMRVTLKLWIWYEYIYILEYIEKIKLLCSVTNISDSFMFCTPNSKSRFNSCRVDIPRLRLSSEALRCLSLRTELSVSISLSV